MTTLTRRVFSAGLTAALATPALVGQGAAQARFDFSIPEGVTQAALTVLANDQALTAACSMGNLELNAFLPLVADMLLTNLTLLGRACDVLRRLCVCGIQADVDRCRAHIDAASATTTALIEQIGYQRAVEVARLAAQSGKTVRQVVLDSELMDAETFETLVSPERVNQLGSRAEPTPRDDRHE